MWVSDFQTLCYSSYKSISIACKGKCAEIDKQLSEEQSEAHISVSDPQTDDTKVPTEKQS